VPAGAFPEPVSVESARTRVGRSDEGEPRGELHGTDRTRDDDPAVLERLTQSFDGVTTELGELVEEEHAVVGEADLARTHIRAPATQQPDGRDRMVRRAEGTRAEQAPR
jgi:hypothetical protein